VAVLSPQTLLSTLLQPALTFTHDFQMLKELKDRDVENEKVISDRTNNRKGIHGDLVLLLWE